MGAPRIARTLFGLATAASLLLGCDRGESGASVGSAELRCASISGTLPGTVTFAQCTDGHTRELSCQRSAPDEKDADVFCACLVDGKMGPNSGGSFMLFREGFDASIDPAAAISTGNRRCGWEHADAP